MITNLNVFLENLFLDLENMNKQVDRKEPIELYSEATIKFDTSSDRIVLDNIYPKVSSVLKTPIGDRKFKQLVGNFIDKNTQKLHTSGPVYLVPFGDIDKQQYFSLFDISAVEVKTYVKEITRKIGTNSEFKLLSNNPIFFVFWCCIRYYSLAKDQRGLNSALVIYALSVYPSVFSTYFKYGANEGVMMYTMDHLSDKYIMKQEGHVFGALFKSISNSYAFLESAIKEGSDKEVIRFIQRIRNDQKSMIKNICDVYMKNHRLGLRTKLTKDDNADEIAIDVEQDNNTSAVDIVSANIVNQLLTNGIDMRRVSQAKELSGIGLADCRFYISKVLSSQYTEEIKNFIFAVIFLYLYDEHKKKEDINSGHFLVWSSELFRKTNSNNPNIKTIKGTLDKWGEETGVHAKFKREASRVNYKKAIFWYFILSIQYYNK